MNWVKLIMGLGMLVALNSYAAQEKEHVPSKLKQLAKSALHNLNRLVARREEPALNFKTFLSSEKQLKGTERQSIFTTVCKMSDASAFPALVGVFTQKQFVPDEHEAYQIGLSPEGEIYLITFPQKDGKELYKILTKDYWQQEEKPVIPVNPAEDKKMAQERVLLFLRIQCRMSMKKQEIENPFMIMGLLKQLHGDPDYQEYYEKHEIHQGLLAGAVIL